MAPPHCSSNLRLVKATMKENRRLKRNSDHQFFFSCRDKTAVILCDPCKGRGWLLCDFCRGQKINVKSESNRIYRRCPSCKAAGYVLCPKCKVFKCVTFPDYGIPDLSAVLLLYMEHADSIEDDLPYTTLEYCPYPSDLTLHSLTQFESIKNELLTKHIPSANLLKFAMPQLHITCQNIIGYLYFLSFFSLHSSKCLSRFHKEALLNFFNTYWLHLSLITISLPTYHLLQILYPIKGQGRWAKVP
ncbi:unnamed protein product [Spirodela intermedia]|uniref:Uncharacterized protein n=1 Tax=Spirodela intermedia TaxID=51605 RepID=A0A7I8JIP9_SPIIN|nr:unnamed protein product [Spirodela intermedia]CAA6670009.1 unnamed protein product [Spirodela intermedia]